MIRCTPRPLGDVFDPLSGHNANMQPVANDIGDEVQGVYQPGCDDTGGTSEPDPLMTAYQVCNYCTTDVLAVGVGETTYLYVRMC